MAREIGAMADEILEHCQVPAYERGPVEVEEPVLVYRGKASVGKAV